MKWNLILIKYFRARTAVLFLALQTTGCMTSLSMQNGPFALNKGEHEIFASSGWTGHSQVLTTSYTAGEDLWQQVQGEKEISEEDFRT